MNNQRYHYRKQQCANKNNDAVHKMPPIFIYFFILFLKKLFFLDEI